MAKGIDIIEYRGLKVRRRKKVVLHLTDNEEQKIHLRFTWDDWCKLVRDINQPISEWEPK